MPLNERPGAPPVGASDSYAGPDRARRRACPPGVRGGRMARMSPMFRRSDRRTETKAPAEHLVTLIRKPGCHLCDDAQEVIEKV